jgi:hypothetical protein
VIFGAIRQSKKKKIVLVETRFGHAFLVDTGSSTGEILGHSKVSYSTFSDIHQDFAPFYLSLQGDKRGFYQTPKTIQSSNCW